MSIVKLSGEVKTVPTAEVIENSWNHMAMSEAMYAKERASFEQHGFVGVIIVRKVKQGGKPLYQVIDGAHRLRLAKDLGMEEIRVNDLGPISSEKAKMLTLQLNDIHGERDKTRYEKLLEELGQAVSAELLATLPVPDAVWAELGTAKNTAQQAQADAIDDADALGIEFGDAPKIQPTQGKKSKAQADTTDPMTYPVQGTISLRFTEEQWASVGPGVLEKIKVVCGKAGGAAEIA